STRSSCASAARWSPRSRTSPPGAGRSSTRSSRPEPALPAGGRGDGGAAGASALGDVADGLDVVAVGVAHEGAVVAGVVLGPLAGLVEHLGAGGHRGVEERPHRGAVRGSEGDVRLPEPLAGGLRPEPEGRLAV